MRIPMQPPVRPLLKHSTIKFGTKDDEKAKAEAKAKGVWGQLVDKVLPDYKSPEERDRVTKDIIENGEALNDAHTHYWFKGQPKTFGYA